MTRRIFTVGHSTHPIDEFVDLLKAHGVEQLVDVRTVPKSRHNPQFGEDQLSQSLPENGIAYHCRVMWRQPPFCGNRFLESWRLTSPACPAWLREAFIAEWKEILGCYESVRENF